MQNDNACPQDRAISRSLNNLPKVTVTEFPGNNHLSDNLGELRVRSQPCSPRLKRRAFTTCIGGTRYIIGKSPL